MAEDNNRLRRAVAEGMPEATALLPPEIAIYKGGLGSQWSNAPYSEIMANCDWLIQLLLETDLPA